MSQQTLATRERGATPDDVQIASIQKNSRETIRVALRSYKGTRSVDVRLYTADRTGDQVATAKGISIRPALLDAVLEALQAAHAVAIEEGLLVPETVR